MAEESPKKIDVSDANREIIYRALVDPKFRRSLERNPAAALGKKEFTAENEIEVRMILAIVKSIRDMIRSVGDELLCANGGPCGIA